MLLQIKTQRQIYFDGGFSHHSFLYNIQKYCVDKLFNNFYIYVIFKFLYVSYTPHNTFFEPFLPYSVFGPW